MFINNFELSLHQAVILIYTCVTNLFHSLAICVAFLHWNDRRALLKYTTQRPLLFLSEVHTHTHTPILTYIHTNSDTQICLNALRRRVFRKLINAYLCCCSPDSCFASSAAKQNSLRLYKQMRDWHLPESCWHKSVRNATRLYLVSVELTCNRMRVI